MSLTLLIKQNLFQNNDIDQWQDGYPNEETIEKDIENNEAYVLEEDGVILGTCMVTIHGEPAYNRIEGKWILNCPYICVHRIAVDNEYKERISFYDLKSSSCYVSRLS